MEQDESRISCCARKYVLKNDRREKKMIGDLRNAQRNHLGAPIGQIRNN